jgi:hypothetical protein
LAVQMEGMIQQAEQIGVKRRSIALNFVRQCSNC